MKITLKIIMSIFVGIMIGVYFSRNCINEPCLVDY